MNKYKLTQVQCAPMRLPDGRLAPIFRVSRVSKEEKVAYPPYPDNNTYLVVVEYVIRKEDNVLAIHIHAPDDFQAMQRVCTAKTKELRENTTKHSLYIRKDRKWHLLLK